MAAQVAEGLAYMHQEGYVHRDVAARNVLVGLDWSCKVSRGVRS
jgi:serine/threonine protein kinase